jgi:hypothetical protein
VAGSVEDGERRQVQASAWRARAHARGCLPCLLSASYPPTSPASYLLNSLSLSRYASPSPIPRSRIPFFFLGVLVPVPVSRTSPRPPHPPPNPNPTFPFLSPDFKSPRPPHTHTPFLSGPHLCLPTTFLSRPFSLPSYAPPSSPPPHTHRCRGVGWGGGWRRFDYLLIESSGIGEPLPVAQASHARPLPHHRLHPAVFSTAPPHL